MPWLVRAVVLRDSGSMVIRHIVFDAPPDTRGALEVGYSIDESYRRHGYAVEAQALFGWANRQHGICQFIASVAPSTIASPGVVRKLGFQHTGSRWGEEDDEELVIELLSSRAE